jgi:hypothetical protein
MRRAALLAVAGALVWAAAAYGFFGGARLASPAAGIGLTFNGTAYPRIACAGGTNGFCAGTVTIRRRGSVIGRSPFAVRSNDAPSVEVRMRAGRAALLRGGRSVTVTISSHDNSNPPQRRTVTQSSHLKSG